MALINSFSSVSLNPYATGPARLEVGTHQFGLLAGVVASIDYLAGLDESAHGSRRERLSVSMQSASTYMNRVFDYLLVSLRSLSAVMVIGRPETHIPVLSFAVSDVPEIVVAAVRSNEPLAVSVSPVAWPVIEPVSEVRSMLPMSPVIPVVFSVV